jgi:hypothetical protein
MSPLNINLIKLILKTFNFLKFFPKLVLILITWYIFFLHYWTSNQVR